MNVSDRGRGSSFTLLSTKAPSPCATLPLIPYRTIPGHTPCFSASPFFTTRVTTTRPSSITSQRQPRRSFLNTTSRGFDEYSAAFVTSFECPRMKERSPSRIVAFRSPCDSAETFRMASNLTTRSFSRSNSAIWESNTFASVSCFVSLSKSRSTSSTERASGTGALA